MSHNPTYDPEPGYDQSAYDPYAEKAPQHNISNMDSYRQATVGPPPSVLGARDNGKSYRYATEAIPEDEEEGGDGHVRFTNGGEPTKSYSSEPKSSGKQSIWAKYGVYIMTALAILFAILFVIMLGLYIKEVTDNTSPNEPSNEAQIDVPSTTTVSAANTAQPAAVTLSTTTAPPESGTPIGDHTDGTTVTQFTLTNSQGMEVELLSLGARLNVMKVNDKDIVLGFDTAEIGNNSDISKYPYGAANGRVCGNLGIPIIFNGAEFTPKKAEGETVYSEGGANGLYQMNFVGEKRGQSVTFTKTGVNNAADELPGSADITVTYTLADNAKELMVSMMATGPGMSLIDMCHSVRFNLNGNGNDVTSSHSLMINANNYYNTRGNLWSPIAGLMDFKASKLIKTNMDTFLDAFPGSDRYTYSYELKGATGLRQAGTLSAGGTEVTIHTNQPVARIAIELADTVSVAGKAGQTYGPKSSVSFITHADPYASNHDGMLLQENSEYKSMVKYTVS